MSASGRPGPFESHLRDAIALNRERASRYAELSAGSSRPISRTLITVELALLPLARWFDRGAARYHEAGIPILEDLFVSMSLAPPFASHIPVNPQAAESTRVPPSDIRRRVHNAYRVGSFAGAATAIRVELGALNNPPFDSMVRHLLESALRLATRAPAHLARARERGLPSPARLLSRLLSLHLVGLAAAARLDARARPLQAQGIPILAQDLPPIPST